MCGEMKIEGIHTYSFIFKVILNILILYSDKLGKFCQNDI